MTLRSLKTHQIRMVLVKRIEIDLVGEEGFSFLRLDGARLFCSGSADSTQRTTVGGCVLYSRYSACPNVADCQSVEGRAIYLARRQISR